MDDSLKAAFRDEDRALAIEIGQRTEGSLSEKIEEMFRELPDPLLSAEDVHDLLGMSEGTGEVESTLDELVDSGVLESSEKTQRPFDQEDLTLYRSCDTEFERIKLVGQEEALEGGIRRLQFSCDGRFIRSIARVDRLDVYGGTGQQRQEYKSHIEGIAESVEEGTPVPNPILLAFDSEHTSVDGEDEGEEGRPASTIVIRPLTDFEIVENPHDPTGSPVQRVRTIEIDLPYRRACFDDEKGASVVDGQQRTAALALVPIDERPLCGLSVQAIVANPDEARRIFQVANNTKKISTDFSRALSAELDDAPGYLTQEKKLAQACRRLALKDAASPFFEQVKYPLVKVSGRPIVFNTLFKAVDEFDGSILRPEDADNLADLVSRAFTIVKDTWPEAWGKAPGDSKLMHGAGLRSMAALLVHKLNVGKEAGRDDEAMWAEVEQSIKRLQPAIAWTQESALAGTEEAEANWQKIGTVQNTSQDISDLTKFLKERSFDLDQAARAA